MSMETIICLLLVNKRRYIDIQTLFCCATIYFYYEKRLLMPYVLYQFTNMFNQLMKYCLLMLSTFLLFNQSMPVKVNSQDACLINTPLLSPLVYG